MVEDGVYQLLIHVMKYVNAYDKMNLKLFTNPNIY